MASVQRDEVCKKCGNTEGIYEIQLRTNEEWFVCEACGWGYQRRARRFGESLLDELKGIIPQDAPVRDQWPMVDAILRDLLDECAKNGYDDTDTLVRDIRSLLGRDSAERGVTEEALLKRLRFYRSLLAKKEGEVIMDYIEEPPKLYSIPLSSLRPMSEFPGFENPPSDAPSEP